jgi:hypothetical protein
LAVPCFLERRHIDYGWLLLPGLCAVRTRRSSDHAPIWLAEEKDLLTTLAEKRMAPPRRESLEQRLADVRLITRTFKENGGDL